MALPLTPGTAPRAPAPRLLRFFRQYELYYVVADERDVVRLRTSYRGEQVFLYGTPERARAVLRSYLERVNHLAQTPEWYNAFTTTARRPSAATSRTRGSATPGPGASWRTAKGDELLYGEGIINTSLPFAGVRARSDITAKAKAADGDADFSHHIREGILPRPGTE